MEDLLFMDDYHPPTNQPLNINHNITTNLQMLQDSRMTLLLHNTFTSLQILFFALYQMCFLFHSFRMPGLIPDYKFLCQNKMFLV